MLAPLSLLKWQETFVSYLQSEDPLIPKGFSAHREDLWIKLGNLLKSYYPAVFALVGQKLWYEEILIPLIQKSPPSDWSLESWAQDFPRWLAQKSHLSPLLCPLAELEKLQIDVFFAPSLPLPSFQELDTVVLSLQPHLRFFSSVYPLFTYKNLLVSGSSLPCVLEKSEEEQWIALFLSRTGTILLHPIEQEECECLLAFENRSLHQALDYIASNKPHLLATLSAHIKEWTNNWIYNEWLGVANNEIQTDEMAAIF